MNTPHQPMTDDQLDVLDAALSSQQNHAAANRLIAALHAELALKDRYHEDGSAVLIVDAVKAGADPAAVVAHLDAETAAVVARTAEARIQHDALRQQLAQRRNHHRRHDEHVKALAAALSGQCVRLEAASIGYQNSRNRNLGALLSGGFSLNQATAALDHEEKQVEQRKLEALASVGIDPAEAPPTPTARELAEQQRQHANRLRADLDQINRFWRDGQRDVAGLPGWFREAIEGGAVDLHNVDKNLGLIPA